MWLIAQPGFEPLLAFLGAIAAILASFAGEEHAPQGSLTRAEYAARLKKRLEDEQEFYIGLKAEGRLRSRFEGLKDYLGERTTPDEPEKPQPFGSIEAAIAAHTKPGEPPRFVLIGDPGSGKSTALRHVALTLVEAYRAAPEEERLPFWINLGDSRNPPDAGELVRQWWGEKREDRDDTRSRPEGRPPVAGCWTG